MVMHYHGLRKTDDGYAYLAKRGNVAKLHGGVLTENWVQARRRIIVADAMRALHKEGLKIVTDGARRHHRLWRPRPKRLTGRSACCRPSQLPPPGRKGSRSTQRAGSA